MGTNQAATRSANCWIGARRDCASSTRRATRATNDAAAGCSTATVTAVSRSLTYAENLGPEYAVIEIIPKEVSPDASELTLLGKAEVLKRDPVLRFERADTIDPRACRDRVAELFDVPVMISRYEDAYLRTLQGDAFRPPFSAIRT